MNLLLISLFQQRLADAFQNMSFHLHHSIKPCPLLVSQLTAGVGNSSSGTSGWGSVSDHKNWSVHMDRQRIQ